jgi:hypothetical protein
MRVEIEVCRRCGHRRDQHSSRAGKPATCLKTVASYFYDSDPDYGPCHCDEFQP